MLTAPFVHSEISPRSYRRRPLSSRSRLPASSRVQNSWLTFDEVHSYYEFGLVMLAKRMRGVKSTSTHLWGHLLPGFTSGLSHEPAKCPLGRLRETSGKND